MNSDTLSSEVDLPDFEPFATPISPESVPSCLDKSSVFFKVLTAAHLPPPRNNISLPPWMCTTPAHRDTFHRIVDSSRPETNPAEDDSSDEDNAAEPPITRKQVRDVVKPIYTPHGRWAWAAGQGMEGAEILLKLHGELIRASGMRYFADGARYKRATGVSLKSSRAC